MVFDPISLIIAVVINVLTMILAKPKPRKMENNIQREGIDQDLERLYGTRRMGMVLTNSKTNTQELSWRFAGDTADPKVGVGITWNGSDRQNRNVPSGSTGFGTLGHQGTRTTMLHVQGPICVKGRENAPFSKEKREIDDFQVQCYDEKYTSRELNSYSGVANYGTGWCVYLEGGVQDVVGNKFGLKAGGNDLWGDTIHAYATAYQDLEKGKAKFTSFPEFSFLLESNHLWDPSTEADIPALLANPANSNWQTPSAWDGRPDNPYLQVLDYLLDAEYGPGFDISEINLESFIDAVEISNLQIGEVHEKETSKIMSGSLEGQVNLFSQATNGMTEPEIIEYTNAQGGRVTINNVKTYSTKPIAQSNITLSTEDTLSDNLSALLAACRGARLFKNKLGQWTIRPAWLLSKDLEIKSDYGDGTLGPYRAVFFPEDEADVTVKLVEDGQSDIVVNANDFYFKAGGTSNTSSTGSSEITSFVKAEHSVEDRVTTIYFSSTPPAQQNDARYATVYSNDVGAEGLIFIPANGTLVRNETENTWVYTGPLEDELSSDEEQWGDKGWDFYETLNADNDVEIGLMFENITPPTSNQRIVIDYDATAFKGRDIVATIVRDPLHIGLDYDATHDSEGLPLVRMLDDATYQSVSIDDRYNQCIVKFPDEFLDYKNNEVTWPVEASTLHNELLIADNNKRLVNSVTVNHLTSKSAARDYAEFTVRQSRSADSLSFKVDYTGIGLEPNDIIQVRDPALNIGNPAVDDNSEYWIVVSTKVNPKGTVSIECTRYEGEDYAYFSELLETSKYVPLPQPAPVVTFPANPVEVFDDKTSGFGFLLWNPPEGLAGAFSYRVSQSTAKVYDANLTFADGDVVWDNSTLKHYTSLTDNNLGSNPSTSPGAWSPVLAEDNDALFVTVQADTDSPRTVIPNVSETRQYTFRVQVKQLNGYGPPAFKSVNIAAVAFGVQSTLRLDSTKDAIVIPKYISAATWVSGTTYIPGELVTHSGSYWVNLQETSSVEPASSQAAAPYWRLNLGGLKDFSGSDFNLRLYRSDESKPINSVSGGIAAYGQASDAASADTDSWWIDSITAVDLTAPSSSVDRGVVGDLTDDRFNFADITSLTDTVLSATLTINCVYKDSAGLLYNVSKAIPYTVSTLGADGIDGKSIAQLSVYLHTPENFDGSNNLIAPATPTGGAFNFDTSFLSPPSGTYNGASYTWSATPPQVTDGVIWVCQLLLQQDINNTGAQAITDTWSTPTLYATYGGSVFTAQMYAKTDEIDYVPTAPDQSLVVYSFTEAALVQPNGNPLTSVSTAIDSGSGTVAGTWYPSVPDGDGVTWVSQATFSIPGTQGIDSTSTWTDAASIGSQGQSIYNGYLLTNVAKGTSVPSNAKPIDDLVAYNFTTERYMVNSGNITTVTGGDGTTVWSTPDSIGDVLEGQVQYVIRSTFTTQGAAGTDETSSWSDPVVFSASGAKGDSGAAVEVIFRSSKYKPSVTTINTTSASSSVPNGIDGWYNDVSSLPSGRHSSWVFVWSSRN